MPKKIIYLLSTIYLLISSNKVLAQIVPAKPEESARAKQLKESYGCEMNLSDPSLQDLICFVLYATEYLVAAAGAVCVFFIAWGSYRYMYDLRHPSQSSTQQGRSTIYHAIIGLVVCVIAYIIVSTIMEGVTQGF